MAIVRWDPFRNITTLQDRINRLFEDAFPRTPDMDEDLVCAWRPQVDIYEGENGFVIQADLPGVDKQDVTVEIKDNVLTISGEPVAPGSRDARALLPVDVDGDGNVERLIHAPAHEASYFRRERGCGAFQRAFSLRSMVAPDQIKASFKNGVLTVEIPKPEVEKTRQVTVSID